jgi:hypothetical protein
MRPEQDNFTKKYDDVLLNIESALVNVYHFLP